MNKFTGPLHKESFKKAFLQKVEIKAANRRAPLLRSRKTLMLAATLMISLGGMAFASEKSLPGSPFYPVKQFVESMESKTAVTPQDKVNRNLRLVSKRFEEINKISKSANSSKYLAGQIEGYFKVLNNLSARLSPDERKSLLQNIKNLKQKYKPAIKSIQPLVDKGTIKLIEETPAQNTVEDPQTKHDETETEIKAGDSDKEQANRPILRFIPKTNKKEVSTARSKSVQTAKGNLLLPKTMANHKKFGGGPETSRNAIRNTLPTAKKREIKNNMISAKKPIDKTPQNFVLANNDNKPIKKQVILLGLNNMQNNESAIEQIMKEALIVIGIDEEYPMIMKHSVKKPAAAQARARRP